MGVISKALIGILLLVVQPNSVFQQQQPNQGRHVYYCGVFPNKYISYEPCPEDASPGGGTNVVDPDETNFGDDDETVVFETCENGGFYVGISCRNTADCQRAAGNLPTEFRQKILTCRSNQCCTVEETTNQRDCSSYNGRTLAGLSCTSNAECNREIGSALLPTQQIACLPNSRSCCIMPRRLPSNALSWRDVCLNGEFMGKFCRQSSDCGDEFADHGGLDQAQNSQPICDQNKFCCSNLRRRRDVCDQSGDINTGIRCQTIRECVATNGEYCSASGNCCRIATASGLGVCDQSGDISTGIRCQSTLNCVASNGEYCSASGNCCRINAVTTLRQCRTGYISLGTRCNVVSDCGVARSRTTICDAGLCCELISSDIGGVDTIGGREYAYCYNQEKSRVTCASQSECQLQLRDYDYSCVNNLCCLTTGEEWKNACGGTMAISSCFTGGTCHDNFFCTSSNYCCECKYGQAASKCGRGCPPGYYCETNGYCCPRCDSNSEVPYGSCFNNLCATGYTCRKGNICCRS